MSTTVFRNRSCFESLLSEATAATTTIQLKMGAPPPDLYEKTPAHKKTEWGFLETGDKKTECDNYTPCPWAKKSSFSTITGKSLELCTENLGSETGSDVIADADDILSLNSSEYYKRANEASGNHLKRKVISEKKAAHSFPPPLTSMTGARSLQVRRRADGGRLIIDSVESPFVTSFLKTERCDGRLRMSFVTAEAATTTSAASADAAVAGEDEDEEIEAAENEVGLDQFNEEVDQLEGEINNNNNDNDNNNNSEMETEMEMEKYQWLSRCKEEGGHGRNHEGVCGNWKPAFWVAIS